MSARAPRGIKTPNPGLTHRAHDLGVRQVVGDDLAHLREVPAVPFLSDDRISFLTSPVFQPAVRTLTRML